MVALLEKEEIILGPESAGLFMSPEEFDGIKQYDENFRYELINGVVVVSPIPLREETSPNELLGYLLYRHKEDHPQGNVLDETLPQQYVATGSSRRIADRLVWTGLGHYPRAEDLPTIAVEFVSGSRRDRQRDYVDKRQEYSEAGIREYWIIDRFQRTMTVIVTSQEGAQEKVVKEDESYETPLLPGFRLPLARVLAAADQCVQESKH